jgi:hypothetical protein
LTLATVIELGPEFGRPQLKGIQGHIHLNFATEGGITPGYAQTNLFTYLYECFEEDGIDPSMVTLVWGNSNSEELYIKWCEHTNTEPKLTVVSNEMWCSITYNMQTDYSQHYERNYTADKPLDKLFTFFCRAHRNFRVDMVNALAEYDMLDDIEWSWHHGFTDSALHPKLEHLVPKKLDGDTSSSATANPGQEFFDCMDTTYFDLVPETFYYNDEAQLTPQDTLHAFLAEHEGWWNTIFITEKTWRCMFNKRPFIIAGNKGTLAHLHSHGFKTFPHIFDESYDTLEDQYRLKHILSQINNIDKNVLHDKIFSEETKEILEHNKEVARQLAGNLSRRLHLFCSGVRDFNKE